MLVTFVLPTQPAGSTGGLTLYRNGPNLCGRARAMPCIVRSNARKYATNLISQLSVWWESPVTTTQRAGWATWANNNPMRDAYGAPRYIVGYAQYMRSNRPRLQFGVPRVDVPPTIQGYPPYTIPNYIYDPTAPTQVQVLINPADAWVSQAGSYLFLWQSYPQSPTRLTPSERYRPMGYIAGNPTTHPPHSTTMTLPIKVQPGQAWFIRTSVSLADGRLSGVGPQ